MPVAVLEYPYESESKLTVYVVSTANPDEEIRIFLSEFKKANTIRSCEEIRNRLVTRKDPPPPWWYFVAKNLLTKIYQANGSMSEGKRVVRIILTYEAICENDSCKCDITDCDKLKIADAMIWIHQNEKIPYRTIGPKINRCLSFIRSQVCLALDLR